MKNITTVKIMSILITPKRFLAHLCTSASCLSPPPSNPWQTLIYILLLQKDLHFLGFSIYKVTQCILCVFWLFIQQNYFEIYPCSCMYECMLGCSVVFDSLQPHGRQPTRLLCPWDFGRQEYWSSLPFPTSGDLPDPEINPCFLHQQADSLPLSRLGSPMYQLFIPSYSSTMICFPIYFLTDMCCCFFFCLVSQFLAIRDQIAMSYMYTSLCGCLFSILIPSCEMSGLRDSPDMFNFLRNY